MIAGLHNIGEGFVSGEHITLHVVLQGFVTMEIAVGGGDNELQLNGQTLQLNGEDLTLGA